jgi:excisionase family DNA binding protein
MPYQHVRAGPVVAMSPTRAAASAQLRPERIQAAVRAGELRAFRVGTKTRILASELERWIASHDPAARMSA